MKKKILSMLLAVCMIVGLLPTIALAATPTETKVYLAGAELAFGAEAAYRKVTEVALDPGSESDWNVKAQMVDGVAVLTLKGANIGSFSEAEMTYSINNGISGNAAFTAAPLKIVVEADSSISCGESFIKANGSITALTIESKNNAKLTMKNKGDKTGIDATGIDVAFTNANIEMRKSSDASVSGKVIVCRNLTVTGGNVNIKSCVSAGGTPMIETSGRATFDGTTFYCENTSNGNGLKADSWTITNNSTVTFKAPKGYSHLFAATNASGNAENIVDKGSVLNVYSGTISLLAYGNLTIDNATVISTSSWDHAFKFCATTTIQNGGSLTLSSEGAGHAVSPLVLGKASATDGEIVVKDGTLILQNEYDADGNLLKELPTVIFAGDYYTLLGAAADGSDAAVVTELTLEALNGNSYLKIAPKDTNSWTTEAGIEGWTYGETAKTPVGAAAYGDVVFTYSDAENGTYTATVPTNAGTYWMKAEVADNAAYTGLSAKVSFTIAKAAAPAAPTGLTATEGETLADVELPEGWTWVDAATTAVGAAGNNTFKANFAKDNYESATNVDVAITVSAAPAGDDDQTPPAGDDDQTPPAGTPDTSNPQTGDNAALLAVLTLVALASMAGAILVSKKVIVR